MKDLSLMIAGLIIIGALVLGFSSGNKVTDYYRLCNDEHVLTQYTDAISSNSEPVLEAEHNAIANCTEWNELTSDTYVVNQNTQTVVDRLSLTKLSGCVVADTNNWSCYSGGMGFINGKYFIQNGDLLPTEHFDKYTYWYYLFLSHL
jgi:hypothetical protein